MNPMILFPSFTIEGEQFCDEAGDKTEADISQAGNLEADDSMGKILWTNIGRLDFGPCNIVFMV